MCENTRVARGNVPTIKVLILVTVPVLDSQGISVIQTWMSVQLRDIIHVKMAAPVVTQLVDMNVNVPVDTVEINVKLVSYGT